MNTNKIKYLCKTIINLMGCYEATQDKAEINDLNIDLDLLMDNLNKEVEL